MEYFVSPLVLRVSESRANQSSATEANAEAGESCRREGSEEDKATCKQLEPSPLLLPRPQPVMFLNSRF